jgi:ankyrin repeat protein
MEPAAKPPAALWIVVALVLAGGAVVMYSLKGLSDKPKTQILGTNAPAAPAPGRELIDAMAAGNAETLGAMAQKGLDLNALYPFPEADGGPATPVAHAAAHGSPAALQALLTAGAAPDTQDANGRTALMVAATSGSVEKTRLLLAAGSLVTASDSDGNTALILASGQGGTPDVLRTLVDAGADPDAPNKQGMTPLMRAAETGDAARCMALLNAGAKADLKDAQGRTAADLARRLPDDQGARCVQMLVQAGG